LLTEKQIKQIMPTCFEPAVWVKPLNDAFKKFGISEPKQQAALLAQIAVESNEMNTLQENLRYNAARLMQVWPKRFRDGTDAQLCAYNPQRLANRVYCNRMGNGSEESDDGYNYRGRGLLQITGKANYAAIGKELGLNLVQFPDALVEPKHAAMSAGAFWKLWLKDGAAKTDTIADDVKVVTGSNSALDKREAYYKRALEVLSVGQSVDGNQGDKGVAVRKKAGKKTAETATSWFE
jgi:putative chitinase